MKELLLKISFGVYLVLLIGVLFVFDGTVYRVDRPETRNISWIPFESTGKYFEKALLNPEVASFKQTLILDLAGNLFLFFPWGFLAPFIFKKLKVVRTVCGTAFLLSLLAELIQFTLRIGVFDADDIIYNTLGAFLGFKLYSFVKWQSSGSVKSQGVNKKLI